MSIASLSASSRLVLIQDFAASQGLGIASQLRQAITLADESLSEEDASSRFWLVDKEGLLTSDMKDVREGLVGFTRKDWKGDKKTLGDVVREIHPTVLIGTSTSPGAFTVSSNSLRPYISIRLTSFFPFPSAGIDRASSSTSIFQLPLTRIQLPLLSFPDQRDVETRRSTDHLPSIQPYSTLRGSP